MSLSKMNSYFELSELAFGLFKNKVFDSRFPYVLVWALTHRCNLDCDYCGLPRLKDSKYDLRGEQLIQLLNMAIESKLKIVSLTGGEPLLHPDILPFIEHCRKNKVLISLNSNGKYIEKNIDFLSNKIFQFVLSFDGPKEAHDKIRGRGSFDVTLNAIRCLQSYKQSFYLTCVLSRENRHLLDEIIQLGASNKVPISFQFVTPHSLTGESIESDLSNVETLILLNKLIELKKHHPKIIKNPSRVLYFWQKMLTNPTSFPTCKAGHVFARISPRGNMNRCGRRSNDIIDYQEIISNGFLSSFRSLDNAPKCSQCDAWSAVNLNTLY